MSKEEHAWATAWGEALLREFDGSLCPACHHSAHDPGACSECPRCELHTDEAMAFVLRYEPSLLMASSDKSHLLAAARDLYWGLVSEHGHDETHEAVWPACLPVHIAMNRYRDAR